MTAAILVFVLNQVFYDIQVWHLKNVVMTHRYAAVAMAPGVGPRIGVSTVYLWVSFLGRINGIAFLLYIGWNHNWLTALILFLGSLALSSVANAFLTVKTGYAGIYLVAQAAVVGTPVTAIAAWWLALKG